MNILVYKAESVHLWLTEEVFQSVWHVCLDTGLCRLLQEVERHAPQEDIEDEDGDGDQQDLPVHPGGSGSGSVRVLDLPL